VGWRSRRFCGNQFSQLKRGIDNVQEQNLDVRVRAVERLLELLDQDSLKMQFSEMLGKRIEEELVKDSQGSAM
jgi:predicted PP-loop superfamily ATPase